MTKEIKLDREVLGKRMASYLMQARSFYLQKNYQEYQYYKGRFVECATWLKDLGFMDLYTLGLEISQEFNMMDKIVYNPGNTK